MHVCIQTPEWFSNFVPDQVRFCVYVHTYILSLIVSYYMVLENSEICTLCLGRMEGGSRGFEGTPYFCSLKLILSLNIKY